MAKAAAALAALPVGAFVARSAEAASVPVAAPSVTQEQVFIPTSMQVSFDDLPYLMSSVMGPPKVETDGVSMTYQFGPWESVAPSGPRFGALRYFDGDGGIAGWRVFDYQKAEMLRDYPCDGIFGAPVADGELFAQNTAESVAAMLNDRILRPQSVKSWPVIARPTVVTPVIFDGDGNVSYALAQGFPDSWDVPAREIIERSIVARDVAFDESATAVFVKSGGAWMPLERVIGVELS